MANRPARYCSLTCKREMAKRRSGRNDTPSVCAVCGDPLSHSQRKRAARYCGPRCKETAKKRRRRKRAMSPP